MALVAGCATSVEQRGNLPTQDKIAEVHPGTTTKDEVIKILGSPSSVSIFNDKSWYYISRRTGQVAFFNPNVLDQQVYIVNFDDQGVVRAVDHKGLQDGNDITPVARATPAPGRELSFLEQVIGGVQLAHFARIARSKSATMLVILIIGFTAGPAVSL